MLSRDSIVSLLGRVRESLVHARQRWGLPALGVFFCLALGGSGSALLSLQTNALEAHRKIEMTSLGALIQARLARELNQVIFLTGGLRAYLAGKNGRLNRAEVERVLRALHEEARYIRYFGIAVGTRIDYVYPAAGNEKVIGLNYRNIPQQWPGVRRVLQGGQPILLGPLDLVQGGRGLVYRAPIRVEGKYWGLVSAVVSPESLLNAAFKGLQEDVDIAVRGRDARGAKGSVFWGSEEIFGNDAGLVEVNVPGGKWIVAISSHPAGMQESGIRLLHTAI